MTPSTGNGSDLAEDRRVQCRAHYLALTTHLSDRQTVVWSEKRGASSGVANRMSASESRVKVYYDLAITWYGMEAIGAPFGHDLEADFTGITRDDLRGYLSGVVTTLLEFTQDKLRVRQ